MKEIKKEKTTTQIYFEYEAIDGTIFRSKDECKEYENTAKCVLKARVEQIVATKAYDAWNLMGGVDDNNVIGFRFKNEEDVKAFLQYYCLCNTYYTRDEYRDQFQKISDQCYDALKNNDLLLVGINCEEEYYIINTVQTIVNNLLNIADDGKVSNPS